MREITEIENKNEERIVHVLNGKEKTFYDTDYKIITKWTKEKGEMLIEDLENDERYKCDATTVTYFIATMEKDHHHYKSIISVDKKDGIQLLEEGVYDFIECCLDCDKGAEFTKCYIKKRKDGTFRIMLPLREEKVIV